MHAAKCHGEEPTVDAGDPIVFALSGALVVGALGPLCRDLRAQLRAARPVVLDLRGIERIDTAGVQVLVAFCRDVRGAGQVVTWAGDCRAVRELGQVLGLGAWLPTDAVTP